MDSRYAWVWGGLGLCVSGLGALGSAGAQAAGLAEVGDTFLVDRWTMRDGLPQNSVLALLEDQEGLIWVATFGGVATFDGLQFERVKAPGLHADRFVSLAQTPDGTMWLGSEHDGVFRLQDGYAEQVGPDGTVWSMVVDPQGQLFVLVGKQVFHVEGDAFTQVPGVVRPLELNSSDQGVFVSGEGVAPQCLSSDCGVLPTPDADWAWSRWAFLEQGWVAVSSHGIFLYREGELRKLGSEVLFSRRDQACMDWDGDSWCLLGSELEPLAEVLLRPSESLFDEIVANPAYLQDKEGGLWIGNDGGGLSRYQKKQARDLSFGTSTHAVVATPWDEIWFLSGRKIRNLDGILERQIEGLGQDRPHDVLFRVRDQVYELIQADNQVHLVLHEETGSRVTDSLPGQELGVAAVEGPWLVRGDMLYFVDVDHQLIPSIALHRTSPDYLWAVRGDESGVWLAERGVGLHRFEDGAIQSTYPWTGSAIRDLVDHDGEIWVGTYGDGLVRLAQGERAVRLGREEGLCDSMISHIYPSTGDHLWLNSNAGLARISIAQVSSFFVGKRLDVNCELFGHAEANGPDGAVDGQGRFWAPTIQGLGMVDPAESWASLMPRLSISEARYGDQILQDGDRALGKGSLSVSYRGLLYSDPKGVRYRYRMLGLDDTWSSETSLQRVDFPKLEPGSYTFEVRARGAAGWGEIERLSFRRQPTWSELRITRVGGPLLAIFCMLSGLEFLRRQNKQLREHLAEREAAEAELEEQRRENQRIYQEIEVGRRLEALGRLSGGVAHDVNNLLTVVAVHAAILEDHEDPNVRKDGGALRDVVERGTEVTRGLLAFGRDRGSLGGAIDVGEEVHEVVPMMRRLIRSDIQVRVDAAAECGAIIGTGALHQILSNLILNSRDSIAKDGEIWIRVRVSGQQVVLEVEDTGAGMSPEELERAFEPYYTTKPLGQGTGLGLSTVRGVVQDLGGQLSLRSTLGKGTCVTVFLDRKPIPLPGESTSPAARLAPLDLVVLIVEDRPEVLRAVELIVKRLGCRAISVQNLKQAVAKIATEEVDLVLSDVMMPGGSGPEVISALRQVKPGLPALLMSGYTGQGKVDLGGTSVIQKPFSKLELREAIDGVFGR